MNNNSENSGKPIISVIIPVYNCADTVETALNSALNQGIENIEIVVVDDASTDGTPAILQKFAAAYPGQVKLIALPKNGGVSAARNAAISQASGKWITLLDADDRYEPNMLKNLLHYAESTDADMVCNNLKIYDHVLERIVGETRFGHPSKIVPLTGKMMFELDNAFRRHNLGFIKPMIKASFLKEKNIDYVLKFRSGEDFLFLAEIILNGAKSFIVPGAGYVYVHRISPSARTVSPTSRAGHGFDDILKCGEYIFEKYGKIMSKAERRGLAYKQQSIIDWLKYMDLLTAIRSKNYRDALAIFLKKPSLALIKFYTVRNRLQDLLMIRASR